MLNGQQLNGAALNGSSDLGLRSLAGEATATASLAASPAFIRSAHVDALATASGAQTVLFRTTDAYGAATAYATAYNNATRFQIRFDGQAIAKSTASGYSEATVPIYGAGRGEASLEAVFAGIVINGDATATANATAKADWLQRIYGQADASATASVPALDVTRNFVTTAYAAAWAMGEPAVNNTIDCMGVAGAAATGEADTLIQALMHSDASCSSSASGFVTRRIKAHGSAGGVASLFDALEIKPGLHGLATVAAQVNATLFRETLASGDAVARVLSNTRLARTAHSMEGLASANANAESAGIYTINYLASGLRASARADGVMIRVVGLAVDGLASANAIGGVVTNAYARAPMFRTVLVLPDSPGFTVAPEQTQVRVT